MKVIESIQPAKPDTAKPDTRCWAVVWRNGHAAPLWRKSKFTGWKKWAWSS